MGNSKLLLTQLLQSQLSPTLHSQFSEQLEALIDDFSMNKLFLHFARVPRQMGNSPIDRTNIHFEVLCQQYGLVPNTPWGIDTYARILLLLHIPAAQLDAAIQKIYATSSMAELQVLMRAFHFFEQPEVFQPYVAEGIRTNMVDVFDAIALGNPYAAQYLNDAQWNQMVLKAIFMSRPLYLIQGLRQRMNPELTRILRDFIHERWSAGRTVSPEVWQIMGSYLNEELLADLQKAMEGGDALARESIVLAVQESNYQPAKEWISQQLENTRSQLSWEDIGKRYAAESH